MALNLKHPDEIATAAAQLGTPPPLASGSDRRAALEAWGILHVDAQLASGGAAQA